MATYQSIKYNVDYGGKAGALIPISTFTSDGSDATASFTSGIDASFDTYLFMFNSIHPETDGAEFQWQCNVAGASGYNETHTDSHFQAAHNEADNDTGLSYTTSMDAGQGTGGIILNTDIGSDNDQTCSGYLHLFNPSSTTFVKHFMSRSNRSDAGDYSVENFHAGYVNVTGAIDDVQFKYSAGEIQAII